MQATAPEEVLDSPTGYDDETIVSSSSGRDLEGAGHGDLEVPRRTGTWVSCVFHIITAVIGAGVLTLPGSVAWLGWVGGVATILLFAGITLYTSQLLADCYFVHGKRNRTYTEAVQSVFGRRGGIAIAWIQYTNLWLTAIAYNIAGGTSIQEIGCMLKNEASPCGELKLWESILIFAGGQLLLSQVPNLDAAWWVSAVGALMSFAYSFIVLGLSIGKVAEGNHHGTVAGRESPDKAWGIMGAFGSIIFAFAFSMILIEIQDTLADGPAPGQKQQQQQQQQGDGGWWCGWATCLRDSSSFRRAASKDVSEGGAGMEDNDGSGKVEGSAGPAAPCTQADDDRQRWQIVQMRKAVTVAMSVITFFFLSIGVMGYLAFGNPPCGQGGNILTCFDDPRWLLIATNFMVLIHIFPAYQVYSQPVFYFLETAVRRSRRFPAWASSWPALVAGRCLYVGVVAIISVCLPFFSDMVGLVGALGFWPATVLFPVEMYIRVYRPSRRMFWFLESINLLCLIITVVAVAGSVQQIAVDASSYTMFS